MEEELEILQSIYPDDIKNINLDKYDKIIFNKKKTLPQIALFIGYLQKR